MRYAVEYFDIFKNKTFKTLCTRVELMKLLGCSQISVKNARLVNPELDNLEEYSKEI